MPSVAHEKKQIWHQSFMWLVRTVCKICIRDLSFCEGQSNLNLSITITYRNWFRNHRSFISVVDGYVVSSCCEIKHWSYKGAENRLRVVPLSLSPSCVTRKKTAKKMAAWKPGSEKQVCFLFHRGQTSEHAREISFFCFFWTWRLLNILVFLWCWLAHYIFLKKNIFVYIICFVRFRINHYYV